MNIFTHLFKSLTTSMTKSIFICELFIQKQIPEYTQKIKQYRVTLPLFAPHLIYINLYMFKLHKQILPCFGHFNMFSKNLNKAYSFLKKSKIA